MMLPQFDYFGITQVSKEEFKKLVDSALNFSSDVSDCMKELSEWLEESGGGNDSILFTICGM